MQTAELTGTLTVPLVELDRGRIAMAGGKAVNLGEMLRAGLPVPPGFCLTTDAYRLATVGPQWTGLLADPPADLAGRARAAILAEPLPAAVTEAVRTAYLAMGPDVPVAVRSSATAEDLEYASFAGQQDSYLNVVGIDAVLDAVRRCWASLWNDRAVSYRAANGVRHDTVRLAVVVQRLVDAAVSGVLFTANPMTGARYESVLDASPGLGEAVVSGAVNPDHFTVRHTDGTVVERRAGDKRVVVRSAAAGGTEVVDTGGFAGLCLTDAQVLELVALGRRVSAHYGAPQDIEWSLDRDGSFRLLQTRPITTLYPVPARRSAAPGDLRAYLCYSLAWQGLSGPLTPLGLSAFRLVTASAAGLGGIAVADPHQGAAPYADSCGRIFLDLTGALGTRIGRKVTPPLIGMVDARSAHIVRTLFDDPRFAVRKSGTASFARSMARIVLRYGVPVLVVQALVNPAAAHRRIGRIGAELERRNAVPDDVAPLARLARAERIIAETIVPVLPRIVPVSALGGVLLGLAAGLLGEQLAPAADLQTVLRGLPHNVTTEMDLALWKLAGVMGDDPTSREVLVTGTATELAERYRTGGLPATAQRAVADFLARYGHRAVNEIDLGVARWSEQPDHIFGVLANYLRLADPRLGPQAQFDAGAAAATAMVDTLVRRARGRGRLRARLVRFALGRARALLGLREVGKYYNVLSVAHARREVLRAAQPLVDHGWLDRVDDVAYVDLPRLATALRDCLAGVDGGPALRAGIGAARAEYEREQRRRRVPRVLLSDGTEPESVQRAADAADGALRGTPASVGVVTGPARVVLDPVAARLEPGEILVAPSTDPGWTPLFLTAGGVVLDAGGMNSHGAVVAREYGIPAVVGVPDATATIVTGQRVTVDGAAGSVLLH
jgi:rifampicin phosphotransferase